MEGQFTVDVEGRATSERDAPPGALAVTIVVLHLEGVCFGLRGSGAGFRVQGGFSEG